eukprot:GILI01018764.1.p1 GENE.GILI01018764.1~~GILI01018764.1.p1  ORF type:complete len:239 (-),score=34.93 GILI01018764.1:126-761(-)
MFPSMMMAPVPSEQAKKYANLLKYVVIFHVFLCAGRFVGQAILPGVVSLLACVVGYFAYSQLNICYAMTYLFFCSLNFIFDTIELVQILTTYQMDIFSNGYALATNTITLGLSLPFYIVASVVSWKLYQELKSDMYTQLEDGAYGGYPAGYYQNPNSNSDAPSYAYRAPSQPVAASSASSAPSASSRAAASTSPSAASFVPFGGKGHRLGT